MFPFIWCSVHIHSSSLLSILFLLTERCWVNGEIVLLDLNFSSLLLFPLQLFREVRIMKILNHPNIGKNFLLDQQCKWLFSTVCTIPKNASSDPQQQRNPLVETVTSAC